MVRLHCRLTVVVVVFVALASPALAESGDPVVGYGDGGTVEIPPLANDFVGPGDIVVRPDGSAVIDISDGDVDFGFSGVVVDPHGVWTRLPRPMGGGLR
jgi:hypothetical protein